jgi:hypothetical protein
MAARTLIVFVALVTLPLTDVSAQMPGSARVPGISITQNPNTPPSAPSTPSRGPSHQPGRPSQLPVIPAAPPSNLLPPLSSGPNPITRPATRGDVFRATPWTYAPRYGRLSALGGGGYYGGYADAGYLPFAGNVPPEPIPPSEGRLNLNILPLSAQVFIDGFYAGTAADFQDRGLWLESGPRRIELRADGYETVMFDVRIIQDQTVNYRRDLAREAVRSEAPRIAATPKTFYVIPGCYAGDTPPDTARLPSGCSPKNVKTIPPVVSRLRSQ